MRYFLEYPDDWIGVPEFGEGEAFATPESWADAVATELVSQLGVFGRRKERRAALGGGLALVAHELIEGGASAGFIWLETMDGPVRFVALVGVDRDQLGDATAADVAGADGAGDFVPPIVREFVTDAGDRGVYVEKHSPLDDEAVHVAVLSATYAFESAEGVILLQSATTDLVGFERFRPRCEALARAFRWDPSPV